MFDKYTHTYEGKQCGGPVPALHSLRNKMLGATIWPSGCQYHVNHKKQYFKLSVSECKNYRIV